MYCIAADILILNYSTPIHILLDSALKSREGLVRVASCASLHHARRNFHHGFAGRQRLAALIKDRTRSGNMHGGLESPVFPPPAPTRMRSCATSASQRRASGAARTQSQKSDLDAEQVGIDPFQRTSRKQRPCPNFHPATAKSGGSLEPAPDVGPARWPIPRCKGDGSASD
jgi:hypothetical protein